MDNTTNPLENDDQLPGLPIPEEESSAGNIRLAIIVAVMVALVIVGYAMLPAQVTNQISGKTSAPTTEVEEAAAPVDSPTEEAAPASPAVTAKEEVAKTTEKETEKETEKKPTRTAAPTTAPVAEASEGADEEPALVVAPTVAPTAIEPVEIAPSIVTMSGKVLDESGRPMAGATIMLKGTKTVASADAKGNYSIEVPSGENTFIYGYGGYEDQVMRFRNGKNQNVTLVPKANSRRRR